MSIDTAQKRAAMVELGGFTVAVYVPSTIDTKLERAQIAFAYDPAAGAGGATFDYHEYRRRRSAQALDALRKMGWAIPPGA